MTKKIAHISFVFFLMASTFVFSQETKKNFNVQTILSRIVPNDKVDFWVLVYNDYGKNKEVYTSGAKTDYLSQSKGFNIIPAEDSFYYIVYKKGGNISYITDISELNGFVGKVDNVEEAALSAVFNGYIIDEQFVNVAGNYYEDKTNYYLDLGKVTSKECPYQKTHYTLTVNKSTGLISSTKDNGTYIELFTKKCSNNPRLLKTEKKELPPDEPKKQPTKKRR